MDKGYPSLEDFLNQREVLKSLRRSVAGGSKSFAIDFDNILEYNKDLAEKLLYNPKDFLNRADEILQGITKLPFLSLRVCGIITDLKPKEIRAEHVDKFVDVEGTVTQVGGLKFKKREKEPEYYRDYQRIRIDDMDVDLADDLVGGINVGNKIHATGILTAAPSTQDQFERLLIASCIVLPEKEECEKRNGRWDGHRCVERGEE